MSVTSEFPIINGQFLPFYKMGDKDTWSSRDEKFIDTAWKVIQYAIGNKFGYRDYLLSGIESTSGQAQTKWCQAFAAFVMGFWAEYDEFENIVRARDCVARLAMKHVRWHFNHSNVHNGKTLQPHMLHG